MTPLRIALALPALATASASAGSITYDAAVNGLSAPAGASFTANGGQLAVETNEYFKYTGTNTLVTILAVSGDGRGAWLVDNPFGTLPVTSLLFKPIASNPLKLRNRNNSDFGLVGFKTTLVPDASSTPGFLALGLAAFGLATRRRT